MGPAAPVLIGDVGWTAVMLCALFWMWYGLLKRRLERLEHAQRLLCAALLLKTLAKHREMPEDEIAREASMTDAECRNALARVTHLGLVTYRDGLGMRYYRVLNPEKYLESEEGVN